ncbi:hypothetical protein CEXT_111201 [Caerostris extrusa]|uniref:Uncharacterized protein n=1 Tax=Caerostris extrusa TaxID=172846 RepID=A0AAV4MYM8_CAEEX|nr:hypothetical protein CEXT_111201 [Caerostris extrusa]
MGRQLKTNSRSPPFWDQDGGGEFLKSGNPSEPKAGIEDLSKDFGTRGPPKEDGDRGIEKGGGKGSPTPTFGEMLDQVVREKM